ncbi:ubiquitin C-terminal hydrolase CreB [Aspergillus ruber CBS 135680]|uniref:Ubiquitin carboxyl-terminal hydrolase n=1 Tax=Aspergillus ruber (strain CBS 135680) TaxID=1388766 RepID=A0A017S9B8_ASPRC|nr:cysteine proteinase [Aspergillus ruber CBS 135680]EYE92785.1 cysteine proteinase [Aspergillus ruber CBS 135680]
MGSFFKSFRGNGGSSTSSSGASPAKKEPQAPPMSPLEKKLQGMGPIRNDGSDKFFGMENYGSTCYCNSILQCLFFSVPFREAVLNYPTRTPIESLEAALEKSLRFQDPNAYLEAEAQAQREKAANPQRIGAPPNQPQKPEDKESPEYKKKVALQTLPLLETQNNSNSYGMSESLFTALKDIFESLVGSKSRIGITRPQQFLDVLRREHEMFRTAMHQDAHEFLNLLLNEVVANVETEALKQPPPPKSLPLTESADSFDLTNSSGSKTPNTTRWVHELFEGTLTSETECLTCEKVSQRDEIFLDLSVDLEQHSSVTSCLRKFSAEEMLCERNKFHCDNCGGLQEAEKRMKIKRLPRILALHLKRFKYTEDLQRLQKLFHRVVYPYHLRLFNTTDDAEDPDRLYELYAVVVHIGGGPYHGHYVSIVKTEDRGWLLFDDEMVEPVDKNYVRNFFGDKPGLACAYVLFYQETTMEAVLKEQEQEDLAASMDIPIPNEKQQNGVPPSPSLNNFQSSSQLSSPSSEFIRPNGFSRPPTAPRLSTQMERTEPDITSPRTPIVHTPPPVPPIPAAHTMHLSPKKSDIQSKKDRVREEKERKIAEKEREKGEKQRRVSNAREHREHQHESGPKPIIDTSKPEEDRHNAPDNGNVDSLKKTHHSFHRFRRSSKSLSHRFGMDKDSRTSTSDLPRTPINEHMTSAGVSPPRKSELPERPLLNHKSGTDAPKEHKHGKWRSFSFRKML